MRLDFETYSEADLTAVGAYKYSVDPSTKIVLMHYELDGRHVSHDPELPLPNEVRRHIETGGRVHAFNSFFELCIWNNVGCRDHGWPELPIEQTRDTMAVAAYNALPLKLETCGEILNLPTQKDKRGKILIEIFSTDKPIGTKKIEQINEMFGTDFAPKTLKSIGVERATRDELKAGLIEFFKAYNEDDVRAEAGVEAALDPLPPTEEKLWLLDQKINMRGVHLDMEAIHNAMRVVEIGTAYASARLQAITGGAVEAPTGAPSILRWLQSTGLDIDSLAAENVSRTLEFAELTPDQREVLEIRKNYGSSSVKKLNAMALCQVDGVVRGLLQYHGATTGRWAGRLVQPQNLPRPSFDVVPELFLGSPPAEIYKRLEIIYDNPIEAVKSVLRHFIIAAPDHLLAACDFSGVESRVVAWLAGEEWKLQAFRDCDEGHGKDNYLHAADVIFGYECTDKKNFPMERQTGKIGELAFGFQGALGAWRNFDKTDRWTDEDVYGHVRKWRTGHPMTVKLWSQLEICAYNAVRNPGQVFSYRDISFYTRGNFLICRIPSGRELHYWKPEHYVDERGKGVVTFWANKQVGTRRMWTKVQAYGGLWCENITQAVARDLMVCAMFKAEEAGLPIVMTVHDELVCQPSIASGLTHEVLEAIMKVPPHWAKGLPLASEGWTDRRYRK